MPPVRKSIKVNEIYDGNEYLDLRHQGINLIYIPNFIDNEEAANDMFKVVVNSSSLKQHSYINRFKKQITPHRLTHASVPDGRRYRFMGIDLRRRPNALFEQVFNELRDLIAVRPETISIPNASVSNAYRYNSDDYIAPHTDDERFLASGNTTYWSDSTVYTLTLLSNSDIPMKYRFSHPEREKQGCELTPRHGSLIIQGSVLHTIVPIKGDGTIGRISITMRSLKADCVHGPGCQKISCPVNVGASNYLYYSNRDATEPQRPKLNITIKRPSVKC